MKLFVFDYLNNNTLYLGLDLGPSFLQVFETFGRKVFPLNLEYLITGGNYNTYQHTRKNSNRMHTICNWNTKTQKSISSAKTGWEEERKEWRKEKKEGGKPWIKIITLGDRVKFKF